MAVNNASDNVFMTQLDAAANWARSNSLWPMPFATACCGIELMATASSRYDIARFGAEVMRFSPRQCDLLIVAGRVVMKMLPVLQRIWLQMPEPKWCISMGACACTGGVFDTYAVVLGVDRFIPVDIYVPGCPPRPEQLLASIIDLQDAIKKHGTLTGKEFADRRTSLGPAPISVEELRRSRDYLLTKTEQDDAAQEQRAHSHEATSMTTLERLTQRFGGEGFASSHFRDNTRFDIPPESLIDVLTFLKGDCGFDLLVDVTAIDLLEYPDARNRFRLVYALANTATVERLFVRTHVDDPDPTVASLVPLWLGADWMEREVFDMFGIRFSGHPNLKRILMPEEFTAFPLRKDYPLRGRGERHNFPVITRAES